MATNALIGIKQKTGTYKCIYLHNDGYYDGAGRTLLDHYNKTEIIREMINLGDMSILGAKLSPDNSDMNPFDNPIDDEACVYYHRDRLDPFNQCRPRIYTEQELLSDTAYIFKYIWDPDASEWFIIEGDVSMGEDTYFTELSDIVD